MYSLRLSILQFSIIYNDDCPGTKQVLAMTESPLDALEN